MIRYLAGVGSALLLVAAGFFLWKGFANRDSLVPAAPAVAALAAPAAAAEPPAIEDAPQATELTREQKRFNRYDRNRDGRVDRDEYLLNRRKAFARLDTNGDGKLSFDEYAIKTETKFVGADADHSGSLNAAEFATTRVVRKARPKCPPVQQVRAAPAASEDDNG